MACDATALASQSSKEKHGKIHKDRCDRDFCDQSRCPATDTYVIHAFLKRIPNFCDAALELLAPHDAAGCILVPKSLGVGPLHGELLRVSQLRHHEPSVVRPVFLSAIQEDLVGARGGLMQA